MDKLFIPSIVILLAPIFSISLILTSSNKAVGIVIIACLTIINMVALAVISNELYNG